MRQHDDDRQYRQTNVSATGRAARYASEPPCCEKDETELSKDQQHRSGSTF